MHWIFNDYFELIFRLLGNVTAIRANFYFFYLFNWFNYLNFFFSG